MVIHLIDMLRYKFATLSNCWKPFIHTLEQRSKVGIIYPLNKENKSLLIPSTIGNDSCETSGKLDKTTYTDVTTHEGNLILISEPVKEIVTIDFN